MAWIDMEVLLSKVLINTLFWTLQLHRAFSDIMFLNNINNSHWQILIYSHPSIICTVCPIQSTGHRPTTLDTAGSHRDLSRSRSTCQQFGVSNQPEPPVFGLEIPENTHADMGRTQTQRGISEVDFERSIIKKNTLNEIKLKRFGMWSSLRHTEKSRCRSYKETPFNRKVTWN